MSHQSSVLSSVSDVCRRHKLSESQLMEHTARLESQVGQVVPVQSVKPSTLDVLSLRASMNGSEFVDRVQRVHHDNLSGMLDLLKALTEDKVCSKYFDPKRTQEAESSSSKTKSSLQTLKERLLEQVGDRVVQSERRSLKELKIFPTRSHYTLDFLPTSTCSPSKSAGPIGSIPLASQESEIVEDLLYCLMGISGTHLRPLKKKSNEVDIDASLDISLRQMVLRMTSLCSNYSTIVQFVEANYHFEVGVVNQALGGALDVLIEDYYVFVAQMHDQWRQHELSLSKLWFYAQPIITTMASLASLCLDVHKYEARGGKTLSILHEHLSSEGHEPSRRALMYVINTTSKPFFRILHTWIHRGVIKDYGGDFFVEDNEVLDLATLPEDYSDDYWERRYSIKDDLIPTFMHPHVDIILRTGKYLNVIHQCEKAVLREKEDEGELSYQSTPEAYTPTLERAYEYASRTLLHMLIKDRDLIGHLKSVKHYFLLDQGDFIVQFMDLCESELMKNVNQVEPTRLESLLELAQRTSAANSDAHKDLVCIELLPYDLIFQMCKIVSIDTASESEFWSPSNPSELSGLEALAFGYRVQWPVSLVLNRKSLACYQMLFRHLLYCKHVERLLARAWITTKMPRQRMGELESAFGSCFALRQKMLNFVQNLQYYMSFEVLEPHWCAMIAKIRQMEKVCNVDEVLTVHSDFLSTCLNDCLLSSAHLLTTVNKLLAVCAAFSAFLTEFVDSNETSFTRDNDEQLELFHDEVAKFDLQFSSVLLSLLDRIARLGRDNYNERVLNILHRLDFNGFYSAKAVEQFGCTE